MSITFLCPHCSKTLKASADRVGRRAKCPQCGNDIVITAEERHKTATPRKGSSRDERGTPPPIGVTPPKTAVHGAIDRSKRDPARTGKQPAKYSRSVVVAASFITLVAGYVAGSLHPMNKMVSEFTNATNTIKESYQAQRTIDSVRETMPPETDRSIEAFGGRGRARLLAAGGDFGAMPPLLAIGKEHAIGDFSIALTGVRVGQLDTEAVAGVPAREQYLLCGFLVKNASAAIMEDLPEREAEDSHSFSISDDEGRFLQHVGPQSPGDEAADEEAQAAEQTRVEAFQLPSPDTQELILSINLAEFGQEGLVGFRIPTSEIEGFSTQPGG